MRNLTSKNNHNKAQTFRDRKNDYQRSDVDDELEEYLDEFYGMSGPITNEEIIKILRSIT